MNLHSYEYIGASGLYPIEDNINNTFIEQIEYSSNYFIQQIEYSSNSIMEEINPLQVKVDSHEENLNNPLTGVNTHLGGVDLDLAYIKGQILAIEGFIAPTPLVPTGLGIAITTIAGIAGQRHPLHLW